MDKNNKTEETHKEILIRVAHLMGEFLFIGDGKHISEKAKDMLMELEPLCVETGIYKHAGYELKDAPMCLQGMSSVELLRHMFAKMAFASKGLQSTGTPRLMIPLICERLRQEDGKEVIT